MEIESENNKHAYLILAHNQFELLKMLCRLLDHPNHDIYIHVDRKATDFSLEQFAATTQYSPIYFVERSSISWGGTQMVFCTIKLLKAAMANREYSYYHLISGADLPLYTAQEIYNFFECNQGKEFIFLCKEEFSFSKNIKERVSLYHPFQEKLGRKKKGLLYFLERLLIRIQRLLRIDRLKNSGKVAECGSQWFSITNSLARYVLDNEKWIKRTFAKTYIPDEMFMPMLIQGTKFKDNLYKCDSEDGYKSCMRYVDWKRGDPYTFRTEDFQELIASGYMFARKFNISVDSEICYRIENYLVERKKRKELTNEKI